MSAWIAYWCQHGLRTGVSTDCVLVSAWIAYWCQHGLCTGVSTQNRGSNATDLSERTLMEHPISVLWSVPKISTHLLPCTMEVVLPHHLMLKTPIEVTGVLLFAVREL